MRIGVNAWRLRGQRTGVGRYLHNVLRHWTDEALAGRADRVTAYTPVPLGAETPLPPTIRERVVRPDWPMLAWENLRLAPAANEDVLLCPSYTRPLAARARTVVTTHDVTLHTHPELYPRRARLAYDRLYGWSARHATLVMTASEAVRGDVARSYRVPESRIRVVPLAADDSFRPLPGDPCVDAARMEYLGGPEPFFLFVGKLSQRRNIPLLLEAFAELRSRRSVEHKLLVIGLNTHGLDVAGLAARLGIADAVVHREYVADDDLVALYNAAETLVLPATVENLSLPAMEAQAVGTPVIAIDTPGMRDTTGGAAWLMARAERRELVEAMASLASEPRRREELAEAGLAEAAKRSWRRCSLETLAVLEEAAELAPPALAAQAHGVRS
jgi:glycosyltransferase involved in cell wall biosynthesis